MQHSFNIYSFVSKLAKTFDPVVEAAGRLAKNGRVRTAIEAYEFLDIEVIDGNQYISIQDFIIILNYYLMEDGYELSNIEAAKCYLNIKYKEENSYKHKYKRELLSINDLRKNKLSQSIAHLGEDGKIRMLAIDSVVHNENNNMRNDIRHYHIPSYNSGCLDVENGDWFDDIITDEFTFDGKLKSKNIDDIILNMTSRPTSQRGSPPRSYTKSSSSKYTSTKGIEEQNRPFICKFKNCMGAFKRLEHLKRHQRIHTGEKPFKCRFPNCQKSFARSDNLAQHLRTHGGGLEYKNSNMGFYNTTK